MNIGYPFNFQSRGRTATVGEERHILNMIEELIFTSPGERVNRPTFGSGMLERVFEPNSLEQAAVLQVAMQAAVQKELGDLVQVQTLEVASEEETLRVTLNYTIRRTGEPRTETLVRSGV
jgi:uncharacterized protein